MTILEIKDKKVILTDKNDSIMATAEAENRSLTSAELDTINDTIATLEQLTTMETALGFKNNTGKSIRSAKVNETPKEGFSLLKTIRDRVENRSVNDAAKDVFAVGRNEFRMAGVSAAGDIVIPAEYRANILAQTGTAGQEIVQEDKKAILPPLVDKLVFSQAGATFLSGLVGDVSIPSYAGTTVGWKTEVAAADDGGGAFAEITLSPKRLTAYIAVSKLFLAQDGVGAEKLLMENISNAVARKLEATILGVAAGSSTQPAGMGYNIANANSHKKAVAVPTQALMVAMETAVDTANALDGNLAYITNGTGRGILKSIDKGVNNDTGEMLLENGLVNGYPLYVTNSAATTAGTEATGELIVFGNWKDLVIAQWGGYDITVDPYTLAATNQVKIVINAYFDAAGLRGTHDAGADLVSYATSFTQEALKIA